MTAKVGKPDAREDYYNIDPSKRHVKVARTLSERAGAGAGELVATVETSSEYVGFQKESYECDSLTGECELPCEANRLKTLNSAAINIPIVTPSAKDTDAG